LSTPICSGLRDAATPTRAHLSLKTIAHCFSLAVWAAHADFRLLSEQRVSLQVSTFL
jgi:hypothetical protein